MIDEKKLIEILKERENLLHPHAFQHGTENGHIINDEQAFGRYSEIGIIRQTVKRLAEECNQNQINQLAMMYAQNMYIYGVDVTKAWETAISQSNALNKAYLRGLHDERKYQHMHMSYQSPAAGPVMTNADRIRNMTDEELAKFIHAVGCNSNYGDDCGFPFCHSMKGNLCHGIKDNTDARTLEWLKSEVIKE